MAEINDKIEADMVDQKDAPASVAPDAPAIAPMNMIPVSYTHLTLPTNREV